MMHGMQVQTAALVTLALTRKKNLADGEGEDEVMQGMQVQTAAFATLALALDTTSAKAIFQGLPLLLYNRNSIL